MNTLKLLLSLLLRYRQFQVRSTLLLRLFLCLLFSHGFVSKDLLVSPIIPIPKNQNNLSDSSNYGITLNSVFGKVIDLIILDGLSDSLFTSDLKSGFRSTSMCTMLVKEAVAYYTTNDTVLCWM